MMQRRLKTMLFDELPQRLEQTPVKWHHLATIGTVTCSAGQSAPVRSHLLNSYAVFAADSALVASQQLDQQHKLSRDLECLSCC